MNADTQPTCAICGDAIDREPMHYNSALLWCECRRCGTFLYDRNALTRESFGRNRHLVSAWIRRQNSAGVRDPVVPPITTSWEDVDKWFDALQYDGFPLSVTQKLDALLLRYAGLSESDLIRPLELLRYPELVAQIAGRSRSELLALNSMLIEMGYVSQSERDLRLVITADGWKKIDALRVHENNSDSAFIAMWFHDSTAAYREATTSALQKCGYRAMIVDETEFNGFIMDQIVALIRQARFVVADFTCQPEILHGEKVQQGVRGGVYWEAGLAYGMGKQVIHTCRDDDESKSRIHFDVAQYRTLFWKLDELKQEIRNLDGNLPDPNFAERLAQRILATVGRGTYSPQ